MPPFKPTKKHFKNAYECLEALERIYRKNEASIRQLAKLLPPEEKEKLEKAMKDLSDN